MLFVYKVLSKTYFWIIYIYMYYCVLLCAAVTQKKGFAMT